MADPFYTPNIPPVSSTHKRSYDTMDPDLDGRPAGTSRRNPSLGSSSSPSGSRERNKRPRNNSESEVDDILVSSSTSMSSSGSSSSSIESYLSARSSFTDISPPLLAADQASAGQLPLMDVPTTLLEQIEEADVPMEDVSMDDVLSFVTPQDPIAPPPAPAPPPAADPNEEMRRAMERVDAFEREMSVLRQSRADPPPRWTPFNPGMEGFRADETSFNDLGPFTPDPFFPQALLPLARSVEQSGEPHPRLNADHDSLDDRLRRLETLERDAALHSNVIRRSRAHREFLDRLVDPILTLGELEPPPPHPSSYDRFPSHQRVQPPTVMANPHTRPPQDRRPPPIPSRSTRSPELAALLADDYLRRDRDREMETELENAIRDAEAHRQRVAQFLSEGPSRSSFSTLRGALDDSSVGDRTHPPSTRRGGRLPGRTQPPNPPQANRPLLWERISEPAVSTVETTHWTPWESALLDMNPFSDLDIISSRSATSSQRPDDELPRFSPPLPSRMATTFAEYTSTWTRGGSYLETNSRARSHGLSNLRHRARPTRSPSPAPSPPSLGPPLTPASLFDPPALGSIPLADRFLPPRSQRNHPAAFAPRTSTDDAMLQSFNESIPSSVIPPPSPVFYSAPLPDIPPPPPEPAPQSRPYGSFDLEAYRAGPFRATLARSMALRGQNRTVRDRGVAVDERRLRDVLGAISDSEGDEDDEDLLGLLPYALGRNRVREEHNRRREALNWTARPHVAPPNPPTTSRTSQTPTSDASRGLEDRHFLPMSIAERRLASIRRVSRPQDQTERLRELLARPTVPPTTRHRTIPERERSISNLREPPDNQPSARSSGLDRWEQRRDTIRRMASRRMSGPGPGPDLPPSTTTPSLTSRLLGNIHEGPPPSMPSVRQRPGPRLMAYRPPSPPTSTYSTAGRGEPRAPLNGRFARSRGFPPHIPPDMVWVDFPSGRFPPSGRRRNFGDYVRDEDLDTSYEGLLSLSTLLGDVKPRGTPADIVSALPRGTYGEWARPGHTEERCPICLDDYEAKDTCLRVPTCSHWFHEGCLQQWLKGARTCPVCRGRVTKPAPPENPAPVAGPSGSNSRNNDREDDDDSDSELDLRHWIPSFPPWRRD